VRSKEGKVLVKDMDLYNLIQKIAQHIGWPAPVQVLLDGINVEPPTNRPSATPESLKGAKKLLKTT
jgi:hypothetical protein